MGEVGGSRDGTFLCANIVHDIEIEDDRARARERASFLCTGGLLLCGAFRHKFGSVCPSLHQKGGSRGLILSCAPF